MGVELGIALGELGADHLHQQRYQGLGFPLGHPGGGLVETEQAGSARHQAGQFHNPSGAGGQLGDKLVGVVAESEEADQVVSRPDLSPFAANTGRQSQGRRPEPSGQAPLQRHLHRLSHGEIGEQGGGLEGPSQAMPVAAMSGQPAHFGPVDLHSAVGGSQAAHPVHERGLATTD